MIIAGLPRARSARGTEPHTHGKWQKHITPKRLTSPYVLRTMLGFIGRPSRPIKSTENYFAQIWIERFKAKNFEPATLIHVISTAERNRFVA